MIKFIENLKIPQIGFLARLSPIKDSKYDEPDIDAYLIKPRGTRGKITESNSNIYIGSGQNFIISCTIILLWILRTSFGCCLRKSNKFLGYLAFLYHVLLGLMFFDFQLICVNEISMFDYSTLRKSTPKFNLSLVLSFIIMGFILSELSQGFMLVSKNHQNETIKDRVGATETKNLSPSQKLILEKYTEGMKVEPTGEHRLFILINNLRFFVIQLITGTLQLLNRSQALLVFVVNLCFFIYFMRLVVRISVFQSKFLLVKYVAQECSTMVLVGTITLFSFTEGMKFSSSKVYKGIEMITVMAMFMTAGTEFLVMAVNIYWEMTKFCRKKTKKVVSASKMTEKAKIEGTTNELTRGSGITWNQGGGESSSKKGQRRTSPLQSAKRRLNSAKKGREKDSLLLNLGKPKRDNSDPFGAESEQNSLKEHRLKRPSRRMRQKGIPIQIRLKGDSSGGEGSRIQKKFLLKKNEEGAGFVLSEED